MRAPRARYTRVRADFSCARARARARRRRLSSFHVRSALSLRPVACRAEDERSIKRTRVPCSRVRRRMLGIPSEILRVRARIRTWIRSFVFFFFFRKRTKDTRIKSRRSRNIVCQLSRKIYTSVYLDSTKHSTKRFTSAPIRDNRPRSRNLFPK